MSKYNSRIFIFKLAVALLLFCVAFSTVRAEDQKISGISSKEFNDLPTFVKSDSLTLKTEERIFEYLGNVEIQHGDMTITSSKLSGKYSADNKIEQLVASENVVITKGDGIRATGEKAVYEAANALLTISENPELQENGSILTADIIKIFLNENRSSAEGTVRVKLVKKDESSNGLTSILGKPAK